jgi:hypothetical protein
MMEPGSMNTQRTLLTLLATGGIWMNLAASPLSDAPANPDEPAAEQTQSDDEVLGNLFIQALNTRSAAVRPIELHEDGPDKTISLTLDGVPRTLRVHPRSMRSPDCQFLIQDATGALVPVEAPPITTYRGAIDGDAASEVAVSIINGEVSAAVRTGAGDSWSVQPCDKIVPGLMPGMYVVYRNADVLPTNKTCGTTEAHRVHAQPEIALNADGEPMQGGIAGGNGGRTQIAFDADFEYFQANNSSVADTIADIEMIMNSVGLIYQNQLGICYAITGFIVRTTDTDPYTSSNSETLLCQFRTAWNSSVLIPRDTAHLMTGKELLADIIGLAWVGVICNVSGNDDTCSPVGGNLAYGLSQSQFSTSLASRITLTAHELGHNWNACHCNQSACAGAPVSDCGIMNSFNNSTSTFEPLSANTISSFLASRDCLGVCYDPVYVNAAWSGIETGSSVFPFNTFPEGETNAPVQGEVTVAGGSYPGAITINKAITITKWTGGTVTIGQ